MSQNTHYHFKMEQRDNSEKLLNQRKTKSKNKTVGQTTNSVSPCLMSKHSSDLQLLSVLLTETHFDLLSWFCFLLATLLGRYPTTLTSPTSWGFQGKPGFTFTASHKGLCGLLCSGTLDACSQWFSLVV